MYIVFFNRSDKFVDGCTQLRSIQEVMQACDIAVVAILGGSDTHYIIDAPTLSALHLHTILVNIARGDVIDQTALIVALSAGQIAGAGLDVFEQEPEVPLALKEMQNVTLLPHIGTSTLEARLDMGVMAVANLIALAAGHDLPNQV